MLDKIKGIGVQMASKATDTVEGISTSVKGGVESLANTATSITDAINEKAVRTSVSQMCTILEIAQEEIKNRPIGSRPLSLTATVNFGIAALEMQISLDPPMKESASDVESNP